MSSTSFPYVVGDFVNVRSAGGDFIYPASIIAIYEEDKALRVEEIEGERHTVMFSDIFGYADCPHPSMRECMAMDEAERDGDNMTDVEADADTLASCGWGTDEDYGGDCDHCD